jgi:GT2 family glycosyltransferase
MRVTICIPTLNRYDLLEKCIGSLKNSTIKPDGVFLIDNGGKYEERANVHIPISVHTPKENMGVAASWNWFMKNVPEKRIICNDDITFFEDTLEVLLKADNGESVFFPAGAPAANSFSCFLIPDKVIEIVGFFDETISPGYAYFEDNDYHRRMILENIELLGVPNCRIGHKNSSTLNAFTGKQRKEHHVKFGAAARNYAKKWGGSVGNEKYKTPYNK